MARARMRDLGITIGEMPTGPHNAITDVPGILVGHRTLVWDEPRIARTGVTVIIPRNGEIWRDHLFAAYHSFNGNGEMTGLLWLEESGVLDGPIAITNTHAVGVVRDALVAYGVKHGYVRGFSLPVVAETYDGWLNDIDAFHVRAEHVEEAIAAARPGPVPEGSVGGGTGMRCHGFKGGIGTASRRVGRDAAAYVVGALVQANYGAMRHLRVNGAPVGRALAARARDEEPPGSIIVILATDAPLLPIQCRRLAQRAAVGLARVGGHGFNSSGDIFLAFATGNHLRFGISGPQNLRWLPHAQIDPLFEGAAEAVEEAILNALSAAETMTGFKGTVHALPLEDVQAMVKRYQG